MEFSITPSSSVEVVRNTEVLSGKSKHRAEQLPAQLLQNYWHSTGLSYGNPHRSYLPSKRQALLSPEAMMLLSRPNTTFKIEQQIFKCPGFRVVSSHVEAVEPQGLDTRLTQLNQPSELPQRFHVASDYIQCQDCYYPCPGFNGNLTRITIQDIHLQSYSEYFGCCCHLGHLSWIPLADESPRTTHFPACFVNLDVRTVRIMGIANLRLSTTGIGCTSHAITSTLRTKPQDSMLGISGSSIFKVIVYGTANAFHVIEQLHCEYSMIVRRDVALGGLCYGMNLRITTSLPISLELTSVAFEIFWKDAGSITHRYSNTCFH